MTNDERQPPKLTPFAETICKAISVANEAIQLRAEVERLRIALKEVIAYSTDYHAAFAKETLEQVHEIAEQALKPTPAPKEGTPTP